MLKSLIPEIFGLVGYRLVQLPVLKAHAERSTVARVMEAIDWIGPVTVIDVGANEGQFVQDLINQKEHLLRATGGRARTANATRTTASCSDSGRALRHRRCC